MSGCFIVWHAPSPTAFKLSSVVHFSLPIFAQVASGIVAVQGLEGSERIKRLVKKDKSL